MKNRPEHDAQVALFQWAAWQAGQRPALHSLYAVPNGGSRHMLEAVNLKREGVKRGVPDICLAWAAGGYHGLYIEMKRESGGRVSPEQKEWCDRLRAAGYRVEICRGFEAGKAAITNYLGEDD
jgi:hypothetical protein